MLNFKRMQISLKLATAALVVLLPAILLPALQSSKVLALQSTPCATPVNYLTTPAINAPANLVAVTISPTQIRLSWQDMSNNEIRFKIERRTGRSEFFTINIVGSNVTEYLDRNLNPGSTYYYRVIANGTMGDSEPSNEATGYTLGATPQIPQLLSPGNFFIVSTTTPRLIWSPAENAGTYSIQISNDLNFTSLIADESGVDNQYYEVPEGMLKMYKGYYWRVSASNSSGHESDWSKAHRFVIFPWSKFYHG